VRILLIDSSRFHESFVCSGVVVFLGSVEELDVQAGTVTYHAVLYDTQS